jgi:CBS domain-containing protein
MSTVGQVMKTSLVTVSSTDTVREAAQRMFAANTGAVLVVEGGRLAAIFTERDLLNRVVVPNLSADSTLVGEVATRDPVTVPAGTSLLDCYDLVKTRRFRHLPVVDDAGRPLGVVSTRDFLHYLAFQLEHEVELGGFVDRIKHMAVLGSYLEELR